MINLIFINTLANKTFSHIIAGKTLIDVSIIFGLHK
jgi:hypothetical protein